MRLRWLLRVTNVISPHHWSPGEIEAWTTALAEEALRGSDYLPMTS